MENQEQQATLADTLRASIATVTGAEPEPVVEATPEATPEPETAEQKAGRTAGRARDAQGKLLPGKPVKAAAESPNVSGGLPPSAEAEITVAAPIPRPSSWKKDMWPIWDKMNTGEPLNAQEARQVAEYNAQRETQFATGVSTYKQIADTAKPIMDAVAPFQADLDRHGIAAPQMIHTLMTAHKNLALGSPQQKLQMFHKLATDYGIPIQALYDQNVQQQYLAQPYTPQPAQQQQPQNIEAMIERTLTNRELQQTVGAMAKDTQKYPFFNYVRPDMAQLLETGEATDLNDAYEKALDLPQHAMLTTVQAAQQAQVTEQQRVAASQAQVRAAKANAVSPRSATPASDGAPTGKQGVRSALVDAIAKHAGGARV